MHFPFQETKLEVDTVADNIYVWNVKMSNFGKESPLDAECAQLLKQFGYNFIELQMGECTAQSTVHRPL